MEKNEKKIEETLNSLEDIKPVKAPDYMYARIKARIEEKTIKKDIIVSRIFLLRVACFFAGLIIFNLIVVRKSGEILVQNQEVKNNTAESIAETYFSSTIYRY